MLKKTDFSLPVAIPSLAAVLVITASCVAAPERTAAALSSIQSYLFGNFSWAYILIVSFYLLFLGVVAVSRFGSIRLGPDNSRPDYSFGSWLAMLFAAGMGVGIMYFGVAEPVMHYADPAVAGTVRRTKAAELYTFFHFGMHAWAIYGIMGLSLAYFAYRYRLPMTVRSALYPILKERVNGPAGHAVDIFALVCTFFGLTTSLGFGVMQLDAGLSDSGLYRESGFLSEAILVAALTGVAVASTLAGMKKGMKRMSEANLVLAALLMLAVLAMGPTVRLLCAFSENLGNYISSLSSLTFSTLAYEGPKAVRWLGSWTVFYWAWWIAWSPFVGLFIARISRGRTVREFIAGVLIVPALFIFLWMTVFGNSAIWLDQGALSGALSRLSSSPDGMLFAFLNAFPGAALLKAAALVTIALFLVTSINSGIIVMNDMASRGSNGSPRWEKILIGVILAVFTASLIRTGGLDALQTLTLAAGLPLGLLMIVFCAALLRAMRLDSHVSAEGRGALAAPASPGDWREQLAQIVSFNSKKDIRQFIDKTVRPAFESLQKEFEKHGIVARIIEGRRGPLSIEFRIPHGNILDFLYGVEADQYRIPDYFAEDENTPEVDSGGAWRPVSYHNGGREGSTIEYLSREGIISDVLREYERFLALSADDRLELRMRDA
ncbi:MAG: BCCT family transporter [Sutterellaceae bacterium]|nr:BCCT family transporter [Sutterellaceae bacterium]MDD7441650.1 BCCT family transporter [Sutterellaceae bacterium]MDY2867966.1 BCCT family transporter [Mesosutterella sp.]